MQKHRIERSRIACRMHCLLKSARRTAFRFQVSYTTELIWLGVTVRKERMRSVPKTDILRDCSQSMIEHVLLTTLRETKATIVATIGVSVFHQLVRVVLKHWATDTKKC